MPKKKHAKHGKHKDEVDQDAGNGGTDYSNPTFDIEGIGSERVKLQKMPSVDPVDPEDAFAMLKERDNMHQKKIIELERLLNHRTAELKVATEELTNFELRSLTAKKARQLRQARRVQVASLLDDDAPLHKSSNNLAWLESSIAFHKTRLAEKYSQDSVDKVRRVWAFVFQMPKTEQVAAAADDEDEEDDQMAARLLKQRGRIPISHEAWITCENCWACDLDIERTVSINGKHLYITVGAPHEVLVQEAHMTYFKMRLQETKGMADFREDLIQYFASNHGGLNEWDNGIWTPRDPSESDNWADRLKSYHDEDKKLTPQDVAARRHKEMNVFTSSDAQRLVQSRLKRLGHLDPVQQMRMKKPKALRQRIAKALEKGHTIPGRRLYNLLTTHGGFRPGNEAVFPTSIDGRTLVADIAQTVLLDLNLQLHPKNGFLSTVKEAVPFTRADLFEMVEQLEQWRDDLTGPGRLEKFSGTLTKFFPLHVQSELEFLRKMWGSLQLIGRTTIVGYNAEGRPKVIDRGPPEQVENNTFCSPGNTLHEHTIPWSWYYQPIDEVRDYFGDDLGLYFSWLGMYTKALNIMSIFGIAVMIFQIRSGGIDKNPLTLPYSIYASIWSISFLETWKRRSNELNFLWGTEGLDMVEQPRPQFNGRVEVNYVTGRRQLVHKSMLVYATKRAIGMLICIMYMAATIVAAMLAMLTRYIEEEGAETLWDQEKYKIYSAALNLSIIVVAGFLYEIMAESINEWENHRTESEFDNALVTKNFMFQFINNYFVLFYIAYGREIPDPFTQKPHPCEGDSCLQELQIQLAIVFAGKTTGKQIFFTLKPLVYKYVFTHLENKYVKKVLNLSKQGLSFVPGAVHLMSRLEEAYGGQDITFEDSVVDAAGDGPGGIEYTAVEEQAMLMPYKGTFDDFNDRVVQFGYLVLFAPAFPLAPLLAFINNVIEIRSAGYKMAKGYQRPAHKAQESIGAWFSVLNILGFCAVITNSSMISFVGVYQARSIGIESSGFLDRLDYSELWVRFLIAEHGSICMRIVILVLSPAVPAWVRDGVATLKFRLQSTYMTREQRELQQKTKAQFVENMNKHRDDMVRHIANKNTKELKEMFARIDIDHSGFIDNDEVHHFFLELGVTLSDLELQEAINDMDSADNVDADGQSGDGQVSFFELMRWFHNKGFIADAVRSILLDNHAELSEGLSSMPQTTPWLGFTKGVVKGDPIPRSALRELFSMFDFITDLELDEILAEIRAACHEGEDDEFVVTDQNNEVDKESADARLAKIEVEMYPYTRVYAWFCDHGLGVSTRRQLLEAGDHHRHR